MKAQTDMVPLLNGIYSHVPDSIELTDEDIQLMGVMTIEELEAIELRKPQRFIPTYHFIQNKIYVREIFIPKGTFAAGYEHTESFTQVVSLGKMLMFSEGGICDIVEAPYTGVGLPGYRKVGYALEDTIWTGFHFCGDETDPDKAFEKTIIKSKTQLEFEKECLEYSEEHLWSE